MSGSDAATDNGCAVSDLDPPHAAAIGTVQAVLGSATITRIGKTPVAPAVGDSVFVGDVLDTGDDGLVAITLEDGTTFHLHADGHVRLDGVGRGAGEPAVVRIAKGIFGVISGKLAE